MPVGVAADPAAAWVRKSTTCKYSGSAALYIKYPAAAPATYRSSLTRAAVAWSAWSGTTGVSISVIDEAAPVPAGGVSVKFNVQEELGPATYANASPKCARGTGRFAGGVLNIATVWMETATDTLRQTIFTHEIGHIIGLGHNEDQNVCATVMSAVNTEDSICGDNGGPYVDDVAGVVAIWRPNATPGFPAESRINVASDSRRHLASSWASTSGWARPVGFRPASPDGYWDWTFVKDKANDGWGWIVNSASGYCLKRESRTSSTHMGWCKDDSARWLVRPGANGARLLNKATNYCLGATKFEPGFPDHATTVDCTHPDSLLQIAKTTQTRTKRSLPEATSVGGPIVGAGSDRCLTAQGGLYSPGREVAIFSCAGTAAQKWLFKPVTGGFRISVFQDPVVPDADDILVDESVASGTMCLTGAGESVSTLPCVRSAATTWTAAPDGTLRNQGTGTCLNVRGGATKDDSRLMLYPCSTESNMVWSSPELLTAGGLVSLAPVSSAGGVLSTAPAPGGNPDQRVRSVLSKNPATDKARFQWEEVAGSNGGGLIRNAETGTCLRWKAQGAEAVLDGACDGNDASYRWAPTQQVKGAWKIQNQYTGECLDLWWAQDSENTTIGMHGCNGGTNQLWRAVPNPSPEPASTNTPGVANLAALGTPTQSSTLDPYSSGAAKAVDGNTDANPSAGSVSATSGSDAYSWWQLDLGDPTAVGTVTIHHAAGSHPSYNEFYVLASNSPIPNSNPAYLGGSQITAVHVYEPWAATTAVKLDGDYRYLRVALDRGSQLSLAEVMVASR
ncbi:ricin-type beta-trefoil lectin domain protein [Leifsonia sp. 1010]|uniref:ricin-type beta-trefoil lectin domain protein n=1 Tax=Leifsonia sp. 1010 TaxID=2817769 RepID=UPI0028591F20|nr:RICIN domain-containing protein [Leifsonia sp. 1010]MDR6611140.1 hypothetical protein [Leifsonia sp. 1010]